jgi:16S rRNA (uracil1498-N3)-methyltransferase
MHIFYSSDINPGDNVFNEFESRHCVNVLRLRVGDHVHVVDGRGGFHLAEITGTDPGHCTFRILESQDQYGRKNYHLHIAIAPTKSIDRFEWFLEKSTEIGIDEITPVICARSERKNIRMDRLEKIILSAMKQSAQAYLPKLNPLCPYHQFIQNLPAGKKIIAHCGNSPKPSLKDILLPGEEICIVIGPEGDFTPEEIKLALKMGYQEIDLGPTRLRTETAGIVACAAVRFVNE